MPALGPASERSARPARGGSAKGPSIAALLATSLGTPRPPAVAGRGAVRAKKASEQFRIQITWSSVL